LTAALAVPDWCPKSVAVQARKLDAMLRSRYDEPPEAVGILHRLAADERMCRVWTELGKRKRTDYRRTEEFLHTATFPATLNARQRQMKSYRQRAAEQIAAGNAESARVLGKLAEHAASLDSPEAIQSDALGLLFHQAFWFAAHGARAIPRRELPAEVDADDPLVVARVIYFVLTMHGALYLLDIYAKNAKEDLIAADEKAIRQRIEDIAAGPTALSKAPHPPG